VRAPRLAGIFVLVLAGPLTAQSAPPTPAPTTVKPAAPASSKSPRAPIDFSGVWEIDLQASKGVSTSMGKAVISIRQNGDRIWIEPIEQVRPYLAAEELIVDGKKYEKAVGRGDKGTVEAQWAKDRKSLWIQTVTNGEDGEEVAFQRSQWELKDGGKTWARRTWTVRKGDTRQSILIFRKRPAAKP
jgi:hypothetical protein